MTLLAVSGLNAHYGSSHVLQGVDLTIDEGVSFGLLGRNGMGKTTLIRTIIGYLRASAGRVAWLGRDATGAASEKMARGGIGYVPEGRGIFPNLTVRENLVMTARPGATSGRGAEPWTLDRVLHTFPRRAERLGHGGQQLSGGEHQMLAIGRALMTNPRLLVLDEATEGLAPLVVAEIWRTISAIRKTGIATLIVDRNYRAVLAHTDRAVVLEKGVAVMSGASAELSADADRLARCLGV